MPTLTPSITPSITILPTAAARDAALSPGALRVLIALPSMEWAPIRVPALVAALGLSRSTVYRAIRVLRSRHYLLRRPRPLGEGAGYEYRVNLLRYDDLLRYDERSASA